MAIKAIKEQYPGVNVGQIICVSPRYGLMYIVNPKAACSSVKLLLSRLESGDFEFDIVNIHKQGASLLPTPAQVGWKKIEKNLNNPSCFFKFSFTRNPVARIVSCYNDKIVKQSASFVPALKKSAGYEDTTSTDLEFLEVLKIIQTQSVVEMDQHWRPQHYNLMSELVDYDFVGKLETFDEDFKHVLTQNNCPEIATVSKNKSSKKVTRLTVSDVKQNELNIINEIYKRDFELFGYDK